jgi:outer membrane lipoprotein-sorting protein
MSNLLRRLPLSRLLLLCGVLVGVGAGATALAAALGVGPTPPPEPLAQAVHGALSAPAPAGVSARVELTDHLLEGANLAAAGGGEAGQLASSPLVTGGAGRLWISGEGRLRLELQAQNGGAQLVYDGRTASLYDGSSNTFYRYTPPQGEGGASASWSTGSQSAGGAPAASAPAPAGPREVPSVARIEEAISRLSQHNTTVSGATPTDVAGRPAYTVRISPSHNGGLIGGAELSWDALTGAPLRAAIYSSTSSTPVAELAVTEISYEPVPASVFEIAPPPGATVKEVSSPKEGSPPSGGSAGGGPQGGGSTTGGSQGGSSQGGGATIGAGGGSRPRLTAHGSGLEAIAVLESPVEAGSQKPSANLPAELPKVQIDGAAATELPTPLGTLLSFERSGIRYLLAGAVTPAAIEAFARGL